MNIAAIQTFLAVTRTGNLNRAAETLNVTQSAVTARLDALEQALGARLLNRARSGATLTKAGFTFLEQAELIVSTWRNARSRASLPQGATGLFSLVCDPGLWTGLGARWVAELRSDNPGTAVEIWPGLITDARRWLRSGQSDAALLSEPLVGAEFDSRVFTVERLVQVSTRPRGVVRWDPDYVFVDYGPGFRTEHARAWPGDDTATVSFSQPDWAMEHLLSRGGSAYLPERLIAEHTAAGTLHRISGSPCFERQVFLSWTKAAHDLPWLKAAAKRDQATPS